MVELLCSLAAQRANGRLELRQGKKRRGFYFEGGKISLTKSNLKSESTARLQELHPTEGETTLQTRQARLRLMNAMSASEGEFEFRPNVPPKERRPVDLMPVVWKAIERTMQPDAIDQRLAGLGLDAAVDHLAALVDGDLGGEQDAVADAGPGQWGAGGEQLGLDRVNHGVSSNVGSRGQ